MEQTRARPEPEPPDPAEPVRRTSEIEEATNLYFIHPIAARLVTLLAWLRVPPNAVSLAGMGFGIAAGFAYFHYRQVGFTVAGFVLMIAWHVMDGADGQLARLTHAQSELGKVLDGICDYVTFIAVYLGLAAALAPRHGLWVLALVLIAGLCHAVQSAAYEAQRQAYNFWGWGRGSAMQPALEAVPPAGVAGRLYGVYVRMQSLGVSPGFDERLATALRAQPERVDAFRRRYRAVFAPAVRRWSVLSANYRSLGIFVCALPQVPLVYFWFEIFGFSLILVILLGDRKARNAGFLRELRAAG